MAKGFLAGVDLGGSNIRVAVANADGDIEARRAIAYPGGAPEGILDRIGRTIDDLARGVWVGAGASAIGMVLPGLVDPVRGTVASAANLDGWGSVDIAARLARPRNVPFSAENDANAAALGEAWRGAARGLKTFVFVAMGTGIGAGLVIDGRIHRGVNGLAGEIAFFPMLPDHIRDPGWNNCLEAVAGGRTYEARAADILGAGRTSADLFDAATSGHVAAAAWLRELHEYVAMALVDVIALLDPEAIVMGGGVVMSQGEGFVEPIRKLVYDAAPAKPPIIRSELGEDAQLLGAIKLAADALEQRR